MGNLIKRLRNKPLKIRKRIMWAGVGLTALFIFLSWLVIKPENINKQDNKDNNHSELETFKEEFREKTKNIGNIASQMTKITDNLSEKIGKDNEININETPRLPLEIN